VTRGETLEELAARERRYDAARRIYDDPRSTPAVRREALRVLWETCLGPARRKVFRDRR
jgi:hypothetical protein